MRHYSQSIAWWRCARLLFPRHRVFAWAFDDGTQLVLPMRRVGLLWRSLRHPHLALAPHALKGDWPPVPRWGTLLRGIAASAPRNACEAECEIILYPDALTQSSGRQRRNVRNKRQALERGLGPLSLRSRNDASALDDFFAMEASGWKAAQASAITLDPQLVAFYRKLWEEFDTDISELHAGNTLVSAQLRVHWGDRIILFKIAYNETYARFSPGQLHLWMTLEHLHDTGSSQALSLNGSPEWAERWPHRSEPAWHANQWANTLQLRYWQSRTKEPPREVL